jgi:hypothetical protein
MTETGKGPLRGSTEWIVSKPRLAARSLANLKADYIAATGLLPQIVPRPLGATTGGQIEVETGQVFVWDDNPPAFQDGYMAEELHHYFQLKERGLLGPAITLTGAQEKEIEAEVVVRMKKSGFFAYDPRNYRPYTDTPCPPGVAGSTS